MDGATTDVYVQCATDLATTDTVYDSTKWYQNMMAHDQYFMNIHACKAATTIPFMVIRTKTKDQLTFDGFAMAYKNLVDWSAKQAAEANLNPVECIDISTVATMEAGVFGGDFPSLVAGDRIALNA